VNIGCGTSQRTQQPSHALNRVTAGRHAEQIKRKKQQQRLLLNREEIACFGLSAWTHQSDNERLMSQLALTKK
jgi:alkylation response protein AidB-like acyl-CoA dehydrogenase